MTSRALNRLETIIARFKSDEQTVRKMAALFAECFADDDVAIGLVDEGGGRWTVAVYFPAAPDRQAVRALAASAAGPVAAKLLAFERVAATDWVRESLAGLAPVQAGRFVIHGAHDRARIPANRIGIEIEAALAFGTGHHGTTRGCLLALDRTCKALNKSRPLAHRHPEVRAQRASKGDGPSASAASFEARASREHLRMTGSRILDLGTGSGVLAIATARALRRHVLATDVDAEAVSIARENARRNRAGGLIEVVRANGAARRCVRAQAPFDLVFANILLGPLQRFAAPLRGLIAPGGRIVLSGILSSQANAAISAYRPLSIERRIDLDGWTTLVLRRPSPSRG